MADAADVAFELADARIAHGLATIAADIPTGVAGECDECGETMPRLIDGRCGFCRDGRRPPLSFYADRAAAPPALVSTTKEHVPMAQLTAAPGRKITIDGAALLAVERLAEASNTSWKQAADQLILQAAQPENGSTTAPEGAWDALLSDADTDDLLDELRARLEARQINSTMQAALDAANARADAAEDKIANPKSLLS